jgi:predicted Zn-ribbon and HTH transcriptional regulator
MKIKICPKCKSKDVQRDMNALDSAIGNYSDWICNDCGFRAKDFPEKANEIKHQRRISKK